MALEKYNKKRNFTKTPEPKGKVSKSHKNLFIIQKHAASHLHYDFRLELNGVLLSWAVPKGPSLDPSIKRLAIHVEDHPVEYGFFEGIIPKGEYGGGTVMLWDKGIWISEDEHPVKAYQSGHLRFTLKAKKLNGRYSLIKLKKDKADNAWFLIKSKDDYTKKMNSYDITKKLPNSVLTNKTIEEIAESYDKIWSKHGLVKKTAPSKQKIKKQIEINKLDIPLHKAPMPQSLVPQLATLVDKAPNDKEWIHELKFDGYRILAFKKSNTIRLLSRNNKEWTKKFPNLVSELKKLPYRNLILDGEVVVLDKEGKSNFQLLQNSFKSNDNVDYIYYVFDLPYVNNFDITTLPLVKRKEILQQIITSEEGAIRYSAHLEGNGEEIFKHSCKMGLEGIVSKLLTSPYEERRTKTWVKVKCVKRQEFVIGGYLPPKGARNYFGSLFLGVYGNGDKLTFCGNVGTGFNESSLKEIYTKLLPLKSANNPFSKRPPGVTKAIWVKPKLVADVEFIEWTREGTLRHPSFKGLRVDKSPTKIIREKETTVAKIEDEIKPLANTIQYKLTHPKKILYAEDKITKLDLAAYYESISDFILPYIVNRPLTLVRCPENYQKCFYQKHLTSSMPKSLFGISVKEEKKADKYIYLKDKLGLMSLVQMGVLEIHPWGSRIHHLNKPDMIVFDLDPSPEVKWKEVVATAHLVKKYLAELNLTSYVKTTGGKGLHVVVPILPSYTWDKVKNFTHSIVSTLVKMYPAKYIGEMSKAKRRGKIFIDYLRNTKGATSVAAYSTRSRIHAPVSVPLHWDELTSKIEDTSYNIFTVPQRLKDQKVDPWEKFGTEKQQLDLSILEE